ncbi:hypothetical protein MRB53_002517 [Persea americana]|uniref:Uncharacterized protein n=1 Tax=Persea americana TaxID=3435 RepID=A0ACC2MUW1_PERAE|nr:hypothetical protein MRB53_002517 [Persea americana]
MDQKRESKTPEARGPPITSWRPVFGAPIPLPVSEKGCVEVDKNILRVRSYGSHRPKENLEVVTKRDEQKMSKGNPTEKWKRSQPHDPNCMSRREGFEWSQPRWQEGPPLDNAFKPQKEAKREENSLRKARQSLPYYPLGGLLKGDVGP